MHKRYFKPLILLKLILICGGLVLVGCSSLPTPAERKVTSDQLSEIRNWQVKMLRTARFDFISYQPEKLRKNPFLTIYIEGDGFSWISRSRISSDPTPINPVGLKLALQHPVGQAVYLARACQYTGGIDARGCDKQLWTNGRFSEKVLLGTNDAINQLKSSYGATHLQLVGYSGGGAVAALIAARRQDVVKLITVAGNLDHRIWTRVKKISPLSDSLNPVDYWMDLKGIEQVHFIGGKDRVVGSFVTDSYLNHFDSNADIKIINLPSFDHHCCWSKAWEGLYLDLMAK